MLWILKRITRPVMLVDGYRADGCGSRPPTTDELPKGARSVVMEAR